MLFMDKDAHNETEQEEFKEAAISISYSFFEQTKNQRMPLGEDLFAGKWKK